MTTEGFIPRVFCCAMLALLFYGTCRADPVVWLDDNVDLRGKRTFFVPQVRNQTGKTFDIDPTALVSSGFHEDLRKEGINILERRDMSLDFVTVEISLVEYAPGSAAQRWLLPGAGATVCVARVTLTDGKSGKLLGEIVANNSVGAGGLFSVGADTSVPEYVGREIAQALIALVKKQQP